jgi:hypothetical protein
VSVLFNAIGAVIREDYLLHLNNPQVIAMVERSSLIMLKKGTRTDYVDPSSTSKWTMLHWASFCRNEKVGRTCAISQCSSHFLSTKPRLSINGL